MRIVFCTLLLFSGYVIGQNPLDANIMLRGPQNSPAAGVVDGVVIKDELPVRTAVAYEPVRLADYVWSKRVFSRIDAREKINFPLFYPYDSFNKEFNATPPQNPQEMINHKGWMRNQQRLSLWTIILQGLMVGDLSMFDVCDETDYNFRNEDGYSLKYRIEKYKMNTDKLSYYNQQNSNYKNSIIQFSDIQRQRSGCITLAQNLKGAFKGETEDYMTKFKDCPTFELWYDDLVKNDVDIREIGKDWKAGIIDACGADEKSDSRKQFRKSWDKAMAKAKLDGADTYLMGEDKVTFLTSDLITAYNIKEDWFFDKERSVLDKRIIALAPVAKWTVDTLKASNRGSLILRDSNTGMLSFNKDGKLAVYTNQKTIELELFWLYFPELRNVLVNYYAYNPQNDAQWMSFDDLFFLREFSAQIYKASDKFDRDIEDYRHNVDALYEAEKIKQEIRDWEQDVWNY